MSRVTPAVTTVTPSRTPTLTEINDKVSKALKTAWSLHCDKLRPEEKAAFDAGRCDGLEAYVTKIQDACSRNRDQSIGYKCMEWFEPIFKAVELLAPIAGAALAVHPNPGQLVLGGIVAAIQTVSRVTAYLKSTVDQLALMGKKANVLLRYEQDIYRDEPEMQAALVKVYGDVLAFCQKAFRFVNKHGETIGKIKGVKLTLFPDFESHFDKEVQAFSDDMDAVQTIALLCDQKRLEMSWREQHAHRQETVQLGQDTRKYFEREIYRDRLLSDLSQRQKEINAREEQLKKDKVKRRALDSLSAMEYRQAYIQRAREYLPGTGLWLVESDRFTAWRTSDKSELLWVKGKPGCGKSVLAAFSIYTLQQERDSRTTCAYHFCRRDNTASQSAIAVLSALARQITERMESTNAALESSFDPSQQSSSPSLNAVRDILQIATSSFAKVYLVIDGLDECEENSSLINEIRDLMHDQISKVKVLFFSRENFVLEQIPNIGPPVQPDRGNNEADLRAYVDSIFTDASQRSNRRKIRDACAAKANGMFLWVKLWAQYLQETPLPEKQQLESIEDVPPGLDKIYSRIIEKLCAQGQAAKWVASLVLMWVTHAREALDSGSMLDAVADYGEAKRAEDALPSRYRDPHHLVAICMNLVTLDKDDCFRLCHESAREVVLRHLCNIGYGEPQIIINEGTTLHLVHDYLAEICLTYFLLQDFEDRRPDTRLAFDALYSKYPFLKYAARFWGSHLLQPMSPNLQDLASQLVRSRSRREISIQRDFYDNPDQEQYMWMHFGTSKILHVVALFGLRDFADALSAALPCLSTEEELGCMDGAGYTPLSLALNKRHLDMTIWLSDRLKATSFRMTTSSRLHAIHQAAVLGWVEILRLLIPEENDLFKLVAGEPHLARACVGDHLEAAKFLIAHAADVDARAYRGATALFICAFFRHPTLVDLLLKHGADVNAKDADGRTPLHAAALTDSAQASDSLLRAGADVDALADGMTPFHIAARVPALNVIKSIKSMHPSHDPRATDQETALHIAADASNYRAVRLLLKLGSSKDAVDATNRTALSVAASRGSPETVKILVEAGCDISVADDQGRTVVHHAVRSKKYSILEYILTQQPLEKRTKLVNATDSHNFTPFHVAILVGNAKMVKLLLDAGARDDLKGLHQTSTLHMAAFAGNANILRLLLKPTTDINSLTTRDETPLHYAARYGDFAYMKQYFLQCSKIGMSVNLNAVDNTNENAFFVALDRGCEEMASFLLSKGSIALRNEDGNYPIHFASRNGFDGVVKSLLRYDGLREPALYNRTPLWYAACFGHLQCVKLLASAAEDTLNICGSFNEHHDAGMPPVMVALSEKHVEIVNYLLDLKAETSAAGPQGDTMLHMAAWAGNILLFRRLLKLGCDGNAQNDHGDTPSHVAIESGHIEVVVELLAHGVNSINVANHDGDTCAIRAAQLGQLDVLRVLMAYGAADFTASDLEGTTSVAIASIHGHEELFNYLGFHGASMVAPDLVGMTPLMHGAAQGFLSSVKHLSTHYPDQIDSRNIAQETALILAAVRSRPNTIKALLRAGADPHLEDVTGMSAADYAEQCELSRQIFLDFNIPRSPKSPEDRRVALSRSIWQTCAELLPANDDVERTTRPVERNVKLWILVSALWKIQDYPNAESCFFELFCEPGSELMKATNMTCDLCDTCKSTESVYNCKTCHITFAQAAVTLCKQCHDDYQGAECQTPKALRELRKLETKIFRVRKAIPRRLPFYRVMEAIVSDSTDGMDDLVRQYEAWEQKYNSAERYEELDRPGQTFVKLVQSGRPWIDRIKTRDEEYHEWALDAEKEYSVLNRAHQVEQDRVYFSCEGHEFFEVHTARRKTLMAEGLDLDSTSGRLTDRFLEKLRQKYAPADLPVATTDAPAPAQSVSTQPASEDSNLSQAVPGEQAPNYEPTGESYSTTDSPGATTANDEPTHEPHSTPEEDSTWKPGAHKEDHAGSEERPTDHDSDASKPLRSPSPEHSETFIEIPLSLQEELRVKAWRGALPIPAAVPGEPTLPREWIEVPMRWQQAYREYQGGTDTMDMVVWYISKKVAEVLVPGYQEYYLETKRAQKQREIEEAAESSGTEDAEEEERSESDDEDEIDDSGEEPNDSHDDE